MRLHCLLISLLVALVGCGPSTKEIMNSWKGSHVSRLIRSWGPPQQVVPDGAGGKIYVWSDSIYLPFTKGKTETRGTYDAYSSTFKSKTTYTPPLVLEGDKVRMFYVDAQGIIYTWRAEGFINDPETDAVLIGGIVVGVGVLLLIAKSQNDSYYDFKY